MLNKPVVKNLLALLFIAGFIAINSFMHAKEFFLLNALPFVFAVVLLAFVRFDWALYFIVFSTPLSFNFENLGVGGIGFYFPTEPLLFGLMLLFFMQSLKKGMLDKAVAKHLITTIILIQLIWLVFTTLTSSMPIVSFKFLVARLWFVVVLFFMASILFKEKRNIEKLIWLYIVPLCGVVIYTVVRHAGYSFDQETAHWVMSPFYKDHTSYGAVLAMYIPIAILLFFKGNYTGTKKVLILVVLGILAIGLVLSYTRAAWVSLVAAFGVYLILLFRIKGKVVLTVFATLVGLFLLY